MIHTSFITRILQFYYLHSQRVHPLQIKDLLTPSSSINYINVCLAFMGISRKLWFHRAERIRHNCPVIDVMITKTYPTSSYDISASPQVSKWMKNPNLLTKFNHHISLFITIFLQFYYLHSQCNYPLQIKDLLTPSFSINYINVCISFLGVSRKPRFHRHT